MRGYSESVALRPVVRTAADRLHQLLKRTERRFLAADYQDLRLRERWFAKDPAAGFDEVVLRVAPDSRDIHSVIIFKPDELGDAVYALPAIAELRKHLGSAHFSLVCTSLTRPLYERSGFFEEIVTYEPDARFKPSRRRILAALNAFSNREFDLAIYLRTYPKTFSDFLAIPARTRIHSLDPRLRSSSPYRMRVSQWGDDRLHYGLNMLEIVSLMTNKRYTHDDLSFPELKWKPEDFAGIHRVFGAQAPGPFVVVHPYAKDETRRYPMQYWSELINHVRQSFDVPFVAIGGKEDPPLPGLDVIPAQGRLSIVETACLIKSASAFIGNLSGPAHLAAALGRPTVTLMSGHSLPNEWAPLGDSLVLRADVPCAPCYQATCPIYRLACLTELRPDRIADTIVTFLQPRIKLSRGYAAQAG